MNAPFTSSASSASSADAPQNAKPGAPPPEPTAPKPATGSPSSHAPGEPPRHERPRTFEELLQHCPEPYRHVLIGSLTDPAEIAEYQAEILVQAMDLVPLLPYEWTLLRDIGDMTVELARYRRIQAQFLDEGRREVLEDLLHTAGWGAVQAAATAKADVAGDARARLQVDKYLAGVHLTRHVIDARAHERRPPDTINRLITDVSKRRLRLVRDLQNGTGEPRSRRAGA